MPFTHHDGDRGRILDAVMLWRAAVVLAVLLASASLVLSTFLYAEQDDVIETVHDLVIKVEAVAVSNETSLCALRADVERRIETSTQFLEENPEGTGGITPAVIQQSLESQQATVEALSALSC